MKTLNNYKRSDDWLRKPIQGGKYQHWLIDNGSLTTRLRQRYDDFLVNPKDLKFAKPLSDEAKLLELTGYQYVLIREVYLMGHNEPAVFAHSILPRASLRGEWNKLGKLGSKPLGAALFANHKVKRTPLEFKKLSSHHPLFVRATRHLTWKPSYLWARRSVFKLTTAHLNCANILVTEIFLPQILHA